ncbi:hypothetical protein K438DRAFT_1937019, partial [Mycena galopus ATCC 62051]
MALCHIYIRSPLYTLGLHQSTPAMLGQPHQPQTSHYHISGGRGGNGGQGGSQGGGGGIGNGPRMRYNINTESMAMNLYVAPGLDLGAGLLPTFLCNADNSEGRGVPRSLLEKLYKDGAPGIPHRTSSSGRSPQSSPGSTHGGWVDPWSTGSSAQPHPNEFDDTRTYNYGNTREEVPPPKKRRVSIPSFDGSETSIAQVAAAPTAGEGARRRNRNAR